MFHNIEHYTHPLQVFVCVAWAIKHNNSTFLVYLYLLQAKTENETLNFIEKEKINQTLWGNKKVQCFGPSEVCLLHMGIAGIMKGPLLTAFFISLFLLSVLVAFLPQGIVIGFKKIVGSAK
jgi:hypothetical protein